jgi:lipopolysaccharide transport system ATP-binding protein
MKGPPNPTPVIRVENVAYYYLKRTGRFRKKKFWALKDVTFSLHKGEILGVIGRNGAGKTTLLQLLAGITAPDRGRIVNPGYTASLLSLQAGFVWYLTGRENTILSGLMLGIGLPTIRERMEDIREFSGLGEFFDQPISSYSSGMSARLGFSIAFHLDPDILLIDEVLGVGDEAFRVKSAEKMKEKLRSDKTAVFASHHIPMVEDLCDRTVWIEDGVCRAVGPTKEVVREYKEFLSGKR